MRRREWGNDIVPDYILQQQQKRLEQEAKVRAAELERYNAAVSFDFLKRHKARVAITVDGVTFETTGDDLDAVIMQARSAIDARRQADDEARRASRSLTWGT
jgi:hypothetical protein